MKVIIGAGGTGGHLYPALALVEYMKKQDPTTEFLFVGTTNRLESIIVPELGYEYIGLHVKGMVGNPLQRGLAGCIFIKSVFNARKIIKKYKPDIVIGFGGYPSASVVKAASMLKIKTIIHEQNSIIGLTNKILINSVDSIVCCYQKAYDNFPKEKTYIYGNPRASAVVSNTPKDIFREYNLDKNKKLAVIVMGSLGSESINNIMLTALQQLQTKEYQVLYVTGKQHFDTMKEAIGELRDNVCLVPYIEDMPSVMAYADIIVSRAGASTIAEITAVGLASILIPSPFVAANHQEYNATELVENEAAIMILEKELTAEVLLKEMDTVLQNEMLLESMRTNAKALGKPNAVRDMYQLIKRMLGE
jgi:UDP-N-acetylglucosamine--N-acetylmuramyl-(pentapeptide) pyrophosphoryl-undecaprenol N-acetylglucosamine transferase